MADSETTSSNRNCPQCGAELPDQAPPEFCPQCLLKAGLATQPLSGPQGTAPLPAITASSRGLPQPGDELGHYRIVRLLGQGGMGAAFEAEDADSGRRVALKVLSHALDSPEARERFFREGRLAASINHPNSVYVFGTEEIAGTPVIAMEYVSGGTLQQRVQAHGPLPTGEAVDAVLQIIAGLEAAQRIGILHRDVKPSNCFIDADGAVKIGDFGLSISTTVRTEPTLTRTGIFLGTPAFCAPEQLRGGELNARSDMYSVGATLFYLLTGHPPFEAGNAVQLLANVLEKRAPSPRESRKEIPSGLAKAVLRCLEKEPGDRFKSYDELRRALAPYSSTAPTPATLGLRFLAGALDMGALSLFGAMATVARFGDPMELMDLMRRGSLEALVWMLGGFTIAILYYTLLEGRWGATLGKTICRVRVVGADNSPPGFGRALVRALCYVVLPVLPFWIVNRSDPFAFLSLPPAMQFIVQFSFYVVLALLFCTMRRHNGFAAVHDLITRTRVIAQVSVEARPTLAAGKTPPPAVEAQPQIGPYHVLETFGQTGGAGWHLGYDLRLLRKVWLRVVAPGTPSVPLLCRNIGRVGRLRWLAGRRSLTENWDAFEEAAGRPLLNLVQQRQSWSHVRYWLYDLATEMSAAARDGDLPVLALDRVWITIDGRAKLLDFPAPGLQPDSENGGAGPIPSKVRSEPPFTATRFLGEVAAVSLGKGKDLPATTTHEVGVPLPLHARDFLRGLPHFSDAGAVAAALKPLLPRVSAVSRWRRAAIVAGCIAFPLFATVSMIFGVVLMQNWSQKNPGLMQLHHLLQQRSAMQRYAKSRPQPTDQQYAVFIAAHYRSFITNEAAWGGPVALSLIQGDARRFAEESVAAHPAPGETEMAEADAALKPFTMQTVVPDVWKIPGFPFVVANASLAIYVGIPALLAALLFRGGLVLRIANVAFVRRDGARASRLRVFWRALVAWSPLCLVVMGHAIWKGNPLVAQMLASSGMLALVILSVALPDRGLPDRLAGTWPVPR